MPEDMFLLSPPVSSTGRNFYPVIRVFHLTTQSGAWLAVTPVALIIEEEGEWNFFALEEGIRQEILENAIPLRDIII